MKRLGEPVTSPATCSVRIFARIGPDDGGIAFAFLVIERKINGHGERHAVGARVGDELFVNVAQLRRGIGVVRKRARGIISGGAQKIIRRIGSRFVVGDELGAVGRSKGHDGFVALVVAMKQAIGLQGLGIETIEEWAIPFGRAAFASEENIVALLQDGLVTVGEQVRQGYAGIFVTLRFVHLPRKARLRRRILRIHEPGAFPRAADIDFAQDGQITAFAPRNCHKAIFHFGQFGGLGGEGRGNPHNFVAMIGFCARIAAIESFRPGECGRGARLPLIIARPCGHAADGNCFLQRNVGKLKGDAPAAVPDFHVMREILEWPDVRIRLMDARDENEASIRRELRGLENSRLAHGRRFAGGDVDERKLRRRVVVEKLLIARASDQVFERGRGRGLAETFLDDGAFGNARLCGRAAVIRRNCPAKQIAAAGRP